MPEHSSGAAITIMKVNPRESFGIIVSTTWLEVTGELDDRCSAYHDNQSPPLSWTRIEDAAAYALIVEDPDAPGAEPYIHWMIWNIPGEHDSLSAGLPNAPRLITPQNAVQGRNDNGSHGWFGPRPPRGDGAHRYHFQMFALDQLLDMGPETPLYDLVDALKGHSIAEGELVGTYEAPAKQ